MGEQEGLREDTTRGKKKESLSSLLTRTSTDSRGNTPILRVNIRVLMFLRVFMPVGDKESLSTAHAEREHDALFPPLFRTVDSDQIYLQTSKSNRDPMSVNAEDVMDAQKNPPITVDHGFTVGGGASLPPSRMDMRADKGVSYAARPPEQARARGAPSVNAAGGPCGVREHNRCE